MFSIKKDLNLSIKVFKILAVKESVVFNL